MNDRGQGALNHTFDQTGDDVHSGVSMPTKKKKNGRHRIGLATMILRNSPSTQRLMANGMTITQLRSTLKEIEKGRNSARKGIVVNRNSADSFDSFSLDVGSGKNVSNEKLKFMIN